MSLAEWQRDLAACIAAPPGTVASGAVSDHDGPGLALTRMLARNWRATRLRHALPLTMRALPATARDELLAAYCDTRPCVSFFPVHEARSFSAFLAEHPASPPHLASIAALEVALIDAFEAGVFDDTASAPARGPLRLARGASRVRFGACPERVLAAALAGTELPPDGGPCHELLIAPGGFVRPLTAAERDVLDACEDGRIPLPGEVTAALIATNVLVESTPHRHANDSGESQECTYL